MDFKIYMFVMKITVLVICITIHEFSHAYIAWKAGDDTPKYHGRISLNPLDHLDPVGTVMMVLSSWVGFGIGWGKPVQINPSNFKSPRWDNLRVSLWGPLSNLLTALVAGIIIRLFGGFMPWQLSMFFVWLASISIGLAMFNLLPISPLDGSHILSALLPIDAARKYDQFMAQYGMFVFLGLIFVGGNLLSLILLPIIRFLFGLLTGINFPF